MSKTHELTQESSRKYQIARLNEEQHVLKARLRELGQPVLTSAERVERAQLQRRRHETQDRILRLRDL